MVKNFQETDLHKRVVAASKKLARAEAAVEQAKLELGKAFIAAMNDRWSQRVLAEAAGTSHTRVQNLAAAADAADGKK